MRNSAYAGVCAVESYQTSMWCVRNQSKSFFSCKIFVAGYRRIKILEVALVAKIRVRDEKTRVGHGRGPLVHAAPPHQIVCTLLLWLW
jgi:hypothetical protein